MKYVYANWKMYLDYKESLELANKLKEETIDFAKIEMAIFPNTLAASAISSFFADSKISVGAQNVNWSPKGAYTGAVSALLFKEAGCTHALVGHSERRHVFGESDEDVRRRLEACLNEGLVPVLCIGETAEDRKAGKTEYRIKKQLMKALEKLDLGSGDFLVAYEPVWAITGSGTGEPCLPEEAERMLNVVQEELAQFTDKKIPLLYGGSVKSENVLSYVSLSNCDGILVGSASAKFDSFSSLIREVEKIG